MKELLGRNYLAIFWAAVIVDLIMIFGPPLFTGSNKALLILLPRWVLMIAGLTALVWAHQEGKCASSRKTWMSVYLVFGFTLAGLLNGAFSPPS